MTEILDIDLDAVEVRESVPAWAYAEAPVASGGWTYRDYQVRAVNAVLAAIREGKRRVLIVIFTGGGKTVVFTCLTRLVVNSGGKVLILAHNDELLNQAADKLYRSTGIEAEKEKANDRASPFAPVVVASVQTLCRTSRLTSFDPDHFSLVIVDESHRSLAKSYRDILDYFSCPTLGVTATPSRGDKKCLSEIYETFDRNGRKELAAFDYGILSGVMDGWAVRLILETIEVEVDAKNVLTTAQVMAKGRAAEHCKKHSIAGEAARRYIEDAVAKAGKNKASDIDGSEVGHRIEPLLTQIAEKIATRVKALNRGQGIVFLPGVETARIMAAAFNAVGISAIAIAGEDSDREEKLSAYMRGDYQCLCNAILYTEGFDHDKCDWLSVLRLTKSDSLYKQMVGRGTRLLNEIIAEINAAANAEERRAIIAKSAKRDLLIFDPLWLVDSGLDLATPYHVLGSDERVAKKALEKRKQGDLLEIQKDGERDLLKSLEKAAAKNAGKKAKTIDPLALAVSIKAEDMAHYEPKEKWEFAAPSEQQLKALEKARIDVSKVHTAGQASTILTKLEQRRKLGLCSPGQMQFMEKLGIKDTALLTQKDFRRIYLQRKHSWRKPNNTQATTPRPAAHANPPDSLPLR